MDEMVDIVDAQEKVLSTVSKKEAHEKGLLHKTVIAEIINSKGEWALVQQAGDKQDAGQYVSPVGGHVSAGESDEDALKREALEEAGLKDFKFKKTGMVVFDRMTRGVRENHLFVLFEIYSDEDLVVNEESVGYKRFTTEEIKQTIKTNPRLFGDAFYPVVKTAYPHLLQ